MKRALTRLHFDWRTLFSGILIVLAFPPWDFMPLIWIALIPWFFAIHRTRSWQQACGQGVWLSVWMSLLGFFWVAYVLRQFGGLPLPLAILGLVLFSLIGQPQFYFFAPLLRRILAGIESKYWPLLALLASLAYAGVDWAIPKLFMDTLGHSLYSAPRLRQLADVGGAPLLTVLIFLVNLSLWGVLHLFRQLPKTQRTREWFIRKSRAPTLAALLLIIAWVYGWFRLGEVREFLALQRSHANLAVIQANIGDFDKLAAESGVRHAAQRVLNQYFDLSREALSLSPKPQAVIWPETSYPSTFRTPVTSDELTRDRKIEQFVRETQVPLLFGGYDHLDGKDFNAFFLLSPRQFSANPGDASSRWEDLRIYRKNILLLFGEYIPGAETFGFIKQAFPQVGNFGRGPGPQSIEVPLARNADPGAPDSVRLAPVICYEALFPDYLIQAAQKGAQVILNITNDSWFGPFGEPQLHLALSTFRSVETRLPLIRSTNTGISAVIQPDGEIQQATELFVPKIVNAQVPVITQPMTTLMLLWGDWFGPTALALGSIGLLIQLGQRKRA